MFYWQRCVKYINKNTGEEVKRGCVDNCDKVENLPKDEICYFLPKETSAITLGYCIKDKFVPYYAPSKDSKQYHPDEVSGWSYVNRNTDSVR